MIENLVRQNIVKLKPYVCARDLYKKGIFMDANENAFGSVSGCQFLLELNRYPDPDSLELRTILSVYLRVSIENIFVASGSDQLIDLLIRLFVDRDEEMIVMEPTYSMYRVQGEIQGVKVRSCLLNKFFQIDLEAFREINGLRAKLLFCCSPNNPTGNMLKKEAILKICKEFEGIVVVDEAYIEFSEQPSFAKEVGNFENLIVLRTFSKAWGLAGLRIGYLVANERIIKYLNKIKPPYNVNSISSYLAVRAIENVGVAKVEARTEGAGAMMVTKITLLDVVETIRSEKNWLTCELRKSGCEVFSSETNFVLVKIPGIKRIVRRLAEDFGIIIRDFSEKPLLEDCCRITIGTRKQNKLLIEALTFIL